MSTTAPHGNPPPLTVAASVAAVEGMLLLLFGVPPLRDGGALTIGLGLFYLVAGGGVLFAAYGLTKQRSWARGPLLVTQLIALLIAFSAREALFVAIVLAVLALIGIVGLVHADTTAALDGRGDPT